MVIMINNFISRNGCVTPGEDCDDEKLDFT